MNNIWFKQNGESSIFSVRSACIVIDNNKILLHRLKTDNFYTLPGGKCAIMEYTRKTLKRELKEELSKSIIVTVNKLNYIVEHHFTFNNSKHHEICFYYGANIDGIEQTSDVSCNVQSLEYKWFDLDFLSQIDLRPKHIIHLIKNLSNSTEHVQMYEGEICDGFKIN